MADSPGMSADPGQDTLETLGTRAMAGDSGALSVLVEALHAPVFRLALRMLVHVADAEDATQEILVKVVTHLGEFGGRSALMTWVHTLAARHLLRFRSSRSERNLLAPNALAALLDAGMRLAGPDSVQEPEAGLWEQEVRLTCTHGMLSVLSREERLAVVLADILGLDSMTAAEIAGTTPEAFRQRLARARGALKPILEERCGLVSPKNPCRCRGQVRAKRAVGGLGPAPTLQPLAPGETEEAARVRRAAREMRGAYRAARAFHVDPPLSPPAGVLERLRAALPTLLG
jgi:RNA polymerase sigma factor (sigma-70 family)